MSLIGRLYNRDCITSREHVNPETKAICNFYGTCASFPLSRDCQTRRAKSRDFIKRHIFADEFPIDSKLL